MRLGGLGGPQHDHRPSAVDALLDHLGIGAVRRQLVVAPDVEAGAAQLVCDEHRQRLIRPGIGDEDVRHTGPCERLDNKTLVLSLESSEGRVPAGYSAVVGSIVVRTCEILLAGKPPSRACSRIISSLGAR